MTGQDDTIEVMLRRAIEDHQRGNIAGAETLYRKILRQEPDHADALHLSGLIAFQRNDFEGAKQLVEQAISSENPTALYFANLGRIEMARTDYTAAIAAWKSALSLTDETSDLNSDIAGAYLKAGKYKEAVDAAHAALNVAPDHASALMNLGLALAEQGQMSAAIDALEKSATLHPENGDVWFPLGQLCQQTDRQPLAEIAYGNAIRLTPDRLESYNNYANLLRDQMRFSEAIDIYREAIEIAPHYSDLHSNLGVALQERGDTQHALVSYREAIRLNPKNAEAHRNLGMALLQQGDYGPGWMEYEWRWKTRHFAPIVRDWKAPQWSGQEAPEKTLLIHCEQGFGDCLQFARFIPIAARRVGKVIVEAPRELAHLLSRLDGVATIVIAGDDLPEVDLQIPLLSLPYAFKTELSSIPDEVPYLFADPQKKESWRQRLHKRPGQKLVGIAWRGSGSHQRNVARSPGLNAFMPLFLLSHEVRLISLQLDGGAELADNKYAGPRVEDYTDNLSSFDDTASLISELDAVVSPDTAVAHLAGALGTKTYLALPKIAEWRWLQDRDDSPWYPNTVLIRQNKLLDWDDVFSFIAQTI